jgi:acyl-CoA thioesterase-1
MHKITVLTGLFFWLVVAVSCGDKEKTASQSKKAEVNTTTSRKVKTILFFGNSLTAGYGVEPSQAFPALIQHKLDSLQLPYQVINAGVSGETSAGGNSRIDWILRQPVDVFVLELGANDGLRGVPVAETKRNLQSIIDKVKTKYPDVKLVLAGMQVPPNMGQKYASDFQAIFPDLAKKNSMVLIPFLLEKVGGEVKLNLEDGIHPTPEGHQILAENVWLALDGVLRE